MDDTQQPQLIEDSSQIQVVSAPEEPGQPEVTGLGIQWKTPELALRFARLLQLTQANQQLEAEVHEIGRRYGGQAGMDPMAVLNLRFQLLIDIIWPIDTEEGQAARLQHDEAFQHAMTPILENAKQQIGMQALAMGAQIPPEQMNKLMEQQRLPAGLQPSPERRTRK